MGNHVNFVYPYFVSVSELLSFTLASVPVKPSTQPPNKPTKAPALPEAYNFLPLAKMKLAARRPSKLGTLEEEKEKVDLDSWWNITGVFTYQFQTCTEMLVTHTYFRWCFRNLRKTVINYDDLDIISPIYGQFYSVRHEKEAVVFFANNSAMITPATLTLPEHR